MPTPSTDRPGASGDDVFLSYNWRDHQDVEVVARALKERGR